MSKLSFTVPKLPAADHGRAASDKFQLSAPSSPLQRRKLCFWLPTHGFSSYFQLWRIPMSSIVLADGGVKMSQTLAMMKTTVPRTSLSLLLTSLVHSGLPVIPSKPSPDWQEGNTEHRAGAARFIPDSAKSKVEETEDQKALLLVGDMDSAPQIDSIPVPPNETDALRQDVADLPDVVRYYR
ncbi:hypothetical protein F4604DRAFT_1686430 [Suillus subluteus]|nr:hypothetical protein F4604DRAFT_1686430 [Suillus subluteus]